MSVDGDNNEQDNLVDEILEQAEQEVISYLPECDEAELRALCQEIGLDIPDDKDNRKKIFRLVMNYLFQMEGENADGGKAKYLQIHGFFRARKLNDAIPIPEIPANLLNRQKLNDEPVHTPNRPVLPPKGTRKLPPAPENKYVPRVYPISPVQVAVGEAKKPANLYHLKECKIRGTIGSPGEKEKLDYDELLSQITENSD